MSRLLSVNVGQPREIMWRGMSVYTSVWKDEVQGRRLVRRLNIDGDAQGDLAGHGENTAPCSSTRWIPIAIGSVN
jgi:MOSC domain-containing protein YiiM